jgi:hypothetical protein
MFCTWSLMLGDRAHHRWCSVMQYVTCSSQAADLLRLGLLPQPVACQVIRTLNGTPQSCTGGAVAAFSVGPFAARWAGRQSI